MSVRVRLTLWYLLVLSLGFVVFGIGVSWQTQQTESASFDQTLRERANELRAYVGLNPTVRLLPHAPNEGAGLVGEAAAWIRILDRHGRVVATEGPALARVPKRLLATTAPGFHNLGSLHMFVEPVLLRGVARATIQTITTADQIDASGRRLIRTMAIAGVFIVLLAALAGLFLADRALRPVDRITRVAQEIGAGDLRRRITPEFTSQKGRAFTHDDEIARLAMTFDAMLARLEEADEQRRQLTADAAHELSTPVAIITTGAETTLRRPRTAEQYRDALQHVVEEGHHLGRMVDDLLLLARADAGRLQMKHELVELDEVCRQVVAGMQPLAENRDVSLELDLPTQPILVDGDETRLGQVIRNLLDNALRYTPTGGTVRLSAERAPHMGLVKPEITVHVRDSGLGIPASERERAFERFHRVIDTMRAPEADLAQMQGSGLGLAICKAIVIAHGGWIRMESENERRAVNEPTGTHVIIGLPGSAG
jgi:signal transduction histidine kinase